MNEEEKKDASDSRVDNIISAGQRANTLGEEEQV